MDETRTNRIMRQIKEICEIAGIRTEQYARVTKKRLDLLGLSRELAREKGALGERIFDLSREENPGDLLNDVTVKAVIARISNLESSLGDLETEIDRIRESASDRTTDVRRKYQMPITDPDGGSGASSGGDAAAAAGGAVATAASAGSSVTSSWESSVPITEDPGDEPVSDSPKKPALLEVIADEDIEADSSDDMEDSTSTSEPNEAAKTSDEDPL